MLSFVWPRRDPSVRAWSFQRLSLAGRFGFCCWCVFVGCWCFVFCFWFLRSECFLFLWATGVFCFLFRTLLSCVLPCRDRFMGAWSPQRLSLAWRVCFVLCFAFACFAPCVFCRLLLFCVVCFVFCVLFVWFLFLFSDLSYIPVRRHATQITPPSGGPV